MSRFFLLFITLLSLTLSQAQAREGDYVSASLGYSAESFSWNTAGDQNGENPNIEKEFSVDDLKATTLFLNIREKNTLGVVGVFEGSYSNYQSGSGEEFEYASDDRADAYYERQADIHGQGFANAIGFGAEMLFAERRFSITPLLGYMINRQRYDMSNGNQVLSVAPSTTAVGSIDDLESRYEARWQGGWVGVDMAYTWAARFSLSGKIRYYDLRYSAEADWDAQSTLERPKSFTHTADGAGTAVMLEMGYQYARNMAFIVNVQFSDWSAERGDSVDYLSGGTTDTNQFNDASWESNTVLFGVRSRF